MQVFRERPLGLRLGSRNGIVYVYGIDKQKPAKSKESGTTTMAEIQYNKLLRLMGKRILRIQEINVELFTLTEISELIYSEKMPIYITFGEEIGIFEEHELHKFDALLHFNYFKSMIKAPPSQYSSMDVQRMTLLFFSLFAVDILCDLKQCEFIQSERENIINWIYSQQIVSSKLHKKESAGFRGGSFLGMSFSNNLQSESERKYLNKWDRVNLASTHNAICILVALGDDLSRLDKEGIIRTIGLLQDETTGSFASMIDGEVDLRFIYCACCICHYLNDWSAIDIEAATQFIVKCQAYDGSLAFDAGLEGHGGSTFVGIASLILMKNLDKIDTDKLLRWLLMNQGNGFKGRPEKPQDSCYSFWLGAVLTMIGKYQFCNHRFNRSFNLLCQSGFGGFSKTQYSPFGDILHGYMGLAGLSLMKPYLPKNLQFTDERFPNLFKRTMFPMTSCTVSYDDIKQNKDD